MDECVRKPLACGMSEIANLLGEEETEKTLLSIMIEMLFDKKFSV